MPASIVIVGGGVIGCELACIYQAFGSTVTVVEGQDRILPLPSVDADISVLLQREMKKKGIAVELARTVTATTPTGTGVSVEIGASPFVEVANPPAVNGTVERKKRPTPPQPRKPSHALPQ